MWEFSASSLTLRNVYNYAVPKPRKLPKLVMSRMIPFKMVNEAGKCWL